MLINAISISDGEVTIQGEEGYEDKTDAYEKLLNIGNSDIFLSGKMEVE